MRVVYLADTQIPSRATNGMQIVRMCAALASAGAEVTLVHPHRFGNEPEGFAGDLWSFYGVRNSFGVVTLPTPLTLRLTGHRRFARVARGIPLTGYVAWRCRPRAPAFTFYSRSMLGAWLAIRARRLWGARSSCRGVFLELHDAPATARAWEVVRAVDGVVTNTDALREHLTKHAPAVRAITARNGVDARQPFDDPRARRELRTRLALDDTTTVVGYTGRVNRDKGVQTILEAAALLDTQAVLFLLVGKVYEDLAEAAAARPSVVLSGFVPPSEVADWVAAMDILVMPTSPDISYAEFTCPLKLLEYMASGRPILCSDLPVLHEVVRSEESALLFHPDDAKSLAAGIERLRRDKRLGAALAGTARADVAQYAWDRRAHRVLDFIRAAP